MNTRPQNQLEALFNQATDLHRKGDLPAAERIYTRLLATAPATPMVLQMLGVAQAQQGRFAEALENVAAALKINPDSAETWMNYGNILRAVGRSQEALSAYERSCALNPRYAEAHYNLGLSYLEFQRYAEALASTDRALALHPNFPEGWSNRGFALNALGRFVEARAAYDKMLTLRPGDPDCLNKRGIVLWNLNRREEAIASLELSLRANPGFVDAWCNLANCLRHMKRLDEALAACDRALALQPNFAPALDHRGIVLWEMKRHDEALVSYGQALALNPNDVEVLANRSVALREMKRFEEAMQDCNRALALKPDHVEALYSRAHIYRDTRRFAEALADYEEVQRKSPQNRHILSGLADAALNLCDWERTAAITRTLATSADTALVTPLVLFGYEISPALTWQYTRNYLAERFPRSLPRLALPSPYQHGRIRVAYVSSDFNRHPVTYQIVEMIERHDREQFEIIGISIGRDDGSEIRGRIVKAFDSFHQVQGQDSRSIAEMMRCLEIDIAVDLNGHTHGSRVEIFAQRPARIQVGYLGFPGSTGADFFDYIIGDDVLLPEAAQKFYSEKIIRLPGTFWVSDSTRTRAPVPTRAAVGLPEQGFVFCAFNNHWKITERMFAVWMRLLAATPGSVLWLKHAGESIITRLKQHAAARGIAPERLIFAPPPAPVEDHVARHAVADLFLDTLPYNAHASGSDALWAGLPIVTCLGDGFPGRVGASLLYAIGLAELVTDSLESYETLALALARDPARLSALRDRLVHNCESGRLFDTAAHCREIEVAYRQMLKP